VNNTIQQQLPSKGVYPEAVAEWVNYELLQFCNQVRNRLNNEFNVSFVGFTAATGATATVWTSNPMPTGSAWAIYLKVVAVDVTGTWSKFVENSYLFMRAAGDASLVAVVSVISLGGPGGIVNFTISGATLILSVQDDGIHQTKWKVHIEVREAA
jgi:hypothetical protein